MKSFRTEIEDPLVEQDIIELNKKIQAYHNGSIDEDSFRSLRLARGVYGQRQEGVQMVRIKVPFGKINPKQLGRIADISDEYSNGNLHLTTRQDIQLHHISLDETPELWEKLERDKLTLREACGNTIRNITASHTAGIDPNEPFDVRPVANEVFTYFLRNPISQEMGRKIKIAFSSDSKDSALTFMHDIGFIATQKDGLNGFKVLVGGGLGSQSRQADTLSEFISIQDVIPIIESIVRVFELHGERNRRMKARLKFLIKEIGFDEFKALVFDEFQRIEKFTGHINLDKYTSTVSHRGYSSKYKTSNTKRYDEWLKSNVVKQKQAGLFAVGIKIKLGDIHSSIARKLVAIVESIGTDELTLSIDQNIWIRHVSGDQLDFLFDKLSEINLSVNGIGSIIDVTACPGTDTCNLAIANSTGVASEIEDFIKNRYTDDEDIASLDIKISGCMNSCGQHMIASIGFQGMSIKAKDGAVLPALQVLLGGGNQANGIGRFADKVIKIPSKRVLNALETVLDNYLDLRTKNESFIAFYDRLGKMHFYEILQPLSTTDNLEETDFVDWHQSDKYVKAIGVGECAGVLVDLVSTLFFDSKEKLEKARLSFQNASYKDAGYYVYQSIVNTAKAHLLSRSISAPSHISILKAYDTEFPEFEIGQYDSATSFALGYKAIDNTSIPEYIDQAASFLESAELERTKTLTHEN